MKSYKSFWELFSFSALIAFGWINYGITTVIFNAAMGQVILSLDWPKDQIPIRNSLTNSLINLGQFVSMPLPGICFGKTSRRWQLIISDFICLGATAMTISANFNIFLLGHFFQGITLGINQVVGPVFIREIAPPEISGKLGSLSKIGFSTGLILAFALAFGLPLEPVEGNIYWIFMFMTPAMVSVIRLFYLFFVWTVDSPKYYLLNNQEEKAKEVISKVYVDSVRKVVLKDMIAEQQNQKQMGIKEFFKKYPKQAVLAFFIITAFYSIGTDVINGYSTLILTGDESGTGTPDQIQAVRIANTLLGVFRTSGALIGGYYLDRWGRRYLYQLGNFVILLSCLCLWFGTQFDMFIPAGIGIFFFSMGIGLSYGLIDPVYLSEIMPSIGVSIFFTYNTVGTMIYLFVFPLIIEIKWIGISGVMIFFFVLCIVAQVIIQYKVIETKGLTMEEIYELFKYGKMKKTSSLANKIERKTDDDTMETSSPDVAPDQTNRDNLDIASLITPLNLNEGEGLMKLV